MMKVWTGAAFVETAVLAGAMQMMDPRWHWANTKPFLFRSPSWQLVLRFACSHHSQGLEPALKRAYFSLCFLYGNEIKLQMEARKYEVSTLAFICRYNCRTWNHRLLADSELIAVLNTLALNVSWVVDRQTSLSTWSARSQRPMLLVLNLIDGSSNIVLRPECWQNA